MPALSPTLTLNEDVVIVPVAELAEDARVQLECAPGDFAVSRVHGRGGSSIVDADAAQLLGRFREPRTLIEAVILYAREKQLDPAGVLEGAYPLLRGMMERRVLVPAGANGATDASSNGSTSWSAGTRLPPGTVTRTLQLLDDTEVYLLARADGTPAVLKVERPSTPADTAATRARLGHEAVFLAHLDGRLAPRLLDRGEVDGRIFLLLEHLAGCDADAVAAERREQRSADGGRALLALVRAVARAYAALHAQGVVHGDVHGRNLVVDRHDRVRLLDFGLARPLLASAAALPVTAERGGIPFFFEPELARAYLDRTLPPPATAEGEQFGVAALLYVMATGAHWQDFRLGRDEMLRDIVDGRPLSFAARGVRPWPALEAVLGRALSRDPAERFPTMDAFADALDAVPCDAAPAHRTVCRTAMPTDFCDRALAPAQLDGAWIAGLEPAPTVSVTYGAAGIALGLLHVAHRRGDQGLLAAADAWVRRAARGIDAPGAFYNTEIQITPEMVGESSPFHAPSGVYMVDALVARALADPMRQAVATQRFVETSQRPAAGLDLACGRTATLLGAALMLDALPLAPAFDERPLRALGDAAMDDVWRALDAKGAIATGEVEYLGIAHGWAGFLYATLHWCRTSGAALPAGVERRLAELAALALPAGRGLEWPWVLRTHGDPPTMPGWCNGSCGHVFLWTMASHMLGDNHHLDLAVGAAWNAWESPEPAATLCCGLAGRAYALLNVHRLTGDDAWLERARVLGARAAHESATHREYPHSLYKGELGVAVLAADLERPDGATMPAFEPLGYRT